MHYYTLSGYGSMIADAIRLTAYQRAIAQAVRPGDMVAELGTGPGVMAVLACQAGAGHVYAIEPNDAIHVAREVAVANGVESRITFLQGLSTRLTPPQRCQVLVSDLRGCVPLFELHLPTIVDARKRWLAPGGRQIPQRDFLYAALIESEKTYADYDRPWRDPAGSVKLEALRKRTINSPGKCRVAPPQLLGTAQRWADLDYRTVTDPSVTGRLTWAAARDGTAHGIALWFDTELADGIGFSNAPGEPELVYGQYFFPFLEPIPVRTGDGVTVDLRAQLVGDDYVWSWTTECSAAGDAGASPVRFEQSSFFGAPLSPERLRRSELGHRPSLNADGRLEQLVLNGMTGDRTLAELAEDLAGADPQRFPDRNAALSFVRELSTRFSA